MTEQFATADEPSPALVLNLPSLQCLQISVDDANSSLASVIAEDWQLPSLTSLYLQSTRWSTFTLEDNFQTIISPSTTSLISTHGQRVTTFAIDSLTAYYMPLHILPPAPIHELVYYAYGLGKTTSIPFTALSVIVLLLIPVESDRHIIPAIWHALKQLRILQSHSLPKLKKVVVLSLLLDELEEPHPIDFRLLDENERRLVEPWHQETPIMVNRHGVRLFTLVGTDEARVEGSSEFDGSDHNSWNVCP